MSSININPPRAWTSPFMYDTLFVHGRYSVVCHNISANHPIAVLLSRIGKTTYHLGTLQTAQFKSWAEKYNNDTLEDGDSSKVFIPWINRIIKKDEEKVTKWETHIQYTLADIALIKSIHN